jgi:hypothetical protein
VDEWTAVRAKPRVRGRAVKLNVGQTPKLTKASPGVSTASLPKSVRSELLCCATAAAALELPLCIRRLAQRKHALPSASPVSAPCISSPAPWETSSRVNSRRILRIRRCRRTRRQRWASPARALRSADYVPTRACITLSTPGAGPPRSRAWFIPRAPQPRRCLARRRPWTRYRAPLLSRFRSRARTQNTS